MSDSNPWPMPSFLFEADFGETYGTINFQEVSNLNFANTSSNFTDTTYFRSSPDSLAYTSNLILRKGRSSSTKIMELSPTDLGQEIKVLAVKINLRDANGVVLTSWTLEDAWLTKWQGMQNNGELVIEEIELACQSISTG